MPRTVRRDEKLKPGTPVKPGNLSGRAANEWDRLTGEMEASNIQVSVAHRTPLALAATIAADIADCWQTVQQEGTYYTNKKTGALMAHPASKRLDALRRDFIKVLTMLGLRSLPVAEQEKTPSLEELLDD